MRLVRRSLALAALALACLALTAGPAAAAVHPFVLGSTLQHPIGVANTKDTMVVTQECSSDVMGLDTSGRVFRYAVLPPNPTCPEVEDYPVAIPQGATKGWTEGDVYVIAGNRVYRIDTRRRVTTFASGPCTADTQASIGFDRVGTWGGGLIALCGHDIYTIDYRGRITQVGDLPDVYGESPVVAPLTFAPYGGWLVVAEEFANGGQVTAVSRSGQHVPLGQWPDAEHVSFVPAAACTFGSTGGAFFDANPSSAPGQLWTYPASDFTGLAGKVIVNGEDSTGVGILNSLGDVQPWDLTNGGTFEGASFVDWAKRCA